MRFLFISRLRDPFEIGARLVAVLAFPGPNETTLRRRATIAWCTDYVRKWIELEPDRESELSAVFPCYVRMSRKEVKAALRTAYNRLDKRILAGKMVRGIIQEHLTGDAVVLPPGMSRHSINELSRLVLAEAHQSDPHNVEVRIWGSSKPILHLASAYEFAARLLPPEFEGQYDMNNRAAHETLLKYAEWAETILVAAKQFRIRPDELLRVRLR